MGSSLHMFFRSSSLTFLLPFLCGSYLGQRFSGNDFARMVSVLEDKYDTDSSDHMLDYQEQDYLDYPEPLPRLPHGGLQNNYEAPAHHSAAVASHAATHQGQGPASHQGPKSPPAGSMLPAYCDPPNPCPLGYTEEDGCIENFQNQAEFSQKYQAGQSCMCDTEHMFSCPEQALPAEKPSDSLAYLSFPDDVENTFLSGAKL